MAGSLDSGHRLPAVGRPRRKRVERVPLQPRKHCPGMSYLLESLEAIDYHRNAMRAALADIQDLFDDADDLEFERQWHEFLRQGGVTADDLRRWRRGETIGPAVKQKRHLRLVSRRQQLPQPDDDDLA